MTIRRIVFWLCVAGVVGYITQHPQKAGKTVAHAANAAMGAVGSVIDAFMTFIGNLNF